MECKKCKGLATLIIRQKDSYCVNCFTENINHKFRACIGKNKVISANDKILVCLSDGIGSTVLLDLLERGITMNDNKKLRIIPYFFHVVDGSGKDNVNEATSLLEKCAKYKFDVYMAHISEYMNTVSILPVPNIIPPQDTKLDNEFQSMKEHLTQTTTNDFLQKIKRHLFIRFAKLVQCQYIFTAETTTTLAINLLSHITLGRGSQIEKDVGFCDAGDNDVKILRPMRDITNEELIHYVTIRGLTATPQYNAPARNSLQSVIRSFVTDLQETFPATISTVCKTANKLSSNYNTSNNKCLICESKLQPDSTKFTALEATNFSRMVSFEPRENILNQICDDDQKVYEDMFPFVDKLCYGCSKNHSEMMNCTLPEHLTNSLQMT